MKYKFLSGTVLVLLACCNIMAQGVAINETGSSPHASAMLHIHSTNKGLLIPRVTTAQRTTIVSPAFGLMVFDTQTQSFWFVNFAGQWVEMRSAADDYFSSGTPGIFTMETGIGVGGSPIVSRQKFYGVDSVNATVHLALQNKHSLGNTSVYLLDETGAQGGTFEFDNGDRHLYIQNGQSSGGDILFRSNQFPETGNSNAEVLRIKRLGGIGIGTNNPGARVHISNALSTIGLRIDQTVSSPSATYGILNDNNTDGSGKKYAIFNRVFGKATSQEIYSTYAIALPSGHPMNAFGGYFEVDTAGSGAHYGIYSKANGPGNYGIYSENDNNDGWAGYFVGQSYFSGRVGIGIDTPQYRIHVVSPNKRALHIETSNSSSDTIFGVHNTILPFGSGVHYGMHTKVEINPTNTQDAYGVHASVAVDGTGTHWGIYGRANGDGNIGVQGISTATGIGIKGVNVNSTGWAGYFDGNTYVQDRLEIRDKIFLRPVGHASGGEIELFDDDGDETVTIRAGQSTTNGAEMLMYNDAGLLTIELDADFNTGKGRVITDELEITGGSDLAEHFSVVSSNSITPGTLVSVDPSGNGKLIPTTRAYDRQVAGVVSGANGISPGVFMGQRATIADGDIPVALVGRVYVFADATTHPVLPGDLMTSSPRPGYAMAVKNHKKAQGAVIGKAITGLQDGTGYVLMLVTLQ